MKHINLKKKIKFKAKNCRISRNGNHEFFFGEI